MTQGTVQSKQAIDQLVGLGRIRVWSFVITVFGDAVVARGGVVASSTLSALVSEMGVKPEAFRVAMSRLTKDGWIERSKKGRLSFYQLSKRGEEVFGPATERIYAPAPGTANHWKLVVMPSALDALPKGAISLGGRSFLTDSSEISVEGLQMSGVVEHVPDWVRARIGSDDLVQGYAAFLAALENLQVGGCSRLQAAVLRSLIVHQWRRLILRHPDLPARFFPDGWQGETCRSLVHEWLERLNAGADAWFDAEIL